MAEIWLSSVNSLWLWKRKKKVAIVNSHCLPYQNRHKVRAPPLLSWVMAASSYTRVLVYLRRATEAPYSCARFSECILDSLGLAGEGLVECSLQDNRLLLQSPAESNISTSTGNTEPSLYKIMASAFLLIFLIYVTWIRDRSAQWSLTVAWINIL